MKKLSLKNKKGFTIIESMISVLMLAVVIAAVSGLVQRSLATNYFSKEQIIANYLAGEAVEYVRHVRDSNFIANNDWLTGIADCFDTVCKVDTVNNSMSMCDLANGDCRLYFTDDDQGGYYSYNGSVLSNYTRTVEIKVISENEFAVIVTIQGESGLFSRIPLVVVEHMTNWY